MSMASAASDSSIAASPTKPHSDFEVIHAPSRNVQHPHQRCLFLSGSIDNDWQASLSASLSHLPVTIFDPLRKDWDSTWVQETSDPRFLEQVNWELDFLERADIIAIYFAPVTQAPITLLELGLHVRKGKERVIVACSKGYWRRGNVEIVCGRFGIEILESLEELTKAVEDRIGELRP